MRSLRRILVVLGGIALGMLLLLLVGYEVAVRTLSPRLPVLLDHEAFSEQIWKTTRILDRRGEVLAELFRERRTLVPLSEIAPHLVASVLHAEDRDFHEHRGISYRAILRALVVDVVKRRYAQGGSTITQQLARNLYLSQDKTLWRKLKETMLAGKIESMLSKDEILYQYLNTIYWGHGNYGVFEAARFYFGKSPADLSVPESALLASMIKSPESISPVKKPQRAGEEMNRLLARMDPSDKAAEAGRVPLPEVVAFRSESDDRMAYAVDAMMVEAKSLTDLPLETGGFTIRSTMDRVIQQAVHAGVDDFYVRHPCTPVVSPESPDSLCSCISEGVIRPGCPVWVRVVSRHPQREGFIVDVLGRVGFLADSAFPASCSVDLLEGVFVKTIAGGEIDLASGWLTEEVWVTPFVSPQVAAVVMDADSGKVLALHGGIDYATHPFNRAITSKRSVGSTIKPVLYLAAMDQLGWRADTRVSTRPLDLPGHGGSRWEVRDVLPLPDEVDLGTALAHSSNVAAVITLRALGLESFRQLWDLWGLPPLVATDLTAALGSSAFSPLEVGWIFSLFASKNGCATAPTMLSGVLTWSAEALERPLRTCGTPPSPRAMTEIRGMLERVVRQGTGTRAQVPGLRILGKTGTGRGGADAWFAGTVGARVVVVWLGSDDHQRIPDLTGGTSAAPLFQSIVRRIEGIESSEF
jgi:penicillin-binding protein 1A